MRSWIPNAITLLNLWCGCAALVAVFRYDFYTCFWFLFVAGLADFADGLAARLLNVKSEHGKELDSLADMVSFGLMPGAVLYALLTLSFAGTVPEPGTMVLPFSWAALPAFLVTLFSALRLAKFNLDTRQTDGFIGLATPSATLFVTGLMLTVADDSFGLRAFVLSPWFLYACTAGLAALLVSEIPMFAFKLGGAATGEGRLRIGFMIAAIALLAWLGGLAFSLIVVLYVGLNLGRLMMNDG
jgi:CDP-diacylglycerol--serine O-phosphatidyltransferase